MDIELTDCFVIRRISIGGVWWSQDNIILTRKATTVIEPLCYSGHGREESVFIYKYVGHGDINFSVFPVAILLTDSQG